MVVSYFSTILGLMSFPTVMATASPQQQMDVGQWSPFWTAALDLRGGANSKDEAPYSFSLTTFSPRGSLSQIEYAMNAVVEGALTVAVTYDGGVALASACKTPSTLVVDVGTRKIAHVSDSIALLYAGLMADSRVLTRKAQNLCLGYQQKYGSNAAVPIATLASELALTMQEYTQTPGVRPFGVALLVAGIESDCLTQTTSVKAATDKNGMVQRTPSQIFRVEPSGRYSAWKAAAIGKGSTKAERLLHEQFEEAMDRDAALNLALSVLLSCNPGQTEREDVELAFVEKGNIQTVAK